MLIRQVSDTTVYLWDYLYTVRVPQLETMSKEYMRAVGTYITGDRGIDNALANQWITTMIPIHQMVEYHKKGSQLRIVNVADTKEIYEHIANHLEAWKHQLERGINIGDAPIEDLIAMDRFAHDVYEHARYNFTEETVASILGRRLEAVGRFNPNNFFQKPVKTAQGNVTTENGITRINAEPESDTPERETYADFLKNRLVLIKPRS
jgi:hypothetical protein